MSRDQFQDGGVHLQKLGQDLQTCVPNGRDLVKVIDTLGMLVQNPLMHPKNLKYRQVYDRSMTFKRRIKPYTAALQFLEASGFKRSTADGAYSLGQTSLTPNQRHVLQQALHVLEKLRDEAVQVADATETAEQIESFKRKPIGDWSTTDCRHFLDTIGLGRYAHALESHKIDGLKMKAMDSRTLASYLGMGTNAHIAQLEQSINRYRGGNAAAPPSVSTANRHSLRSQSSASSGGTPLSTRDPLQGLEKIVQQMKEIIEQSRRDHIDLPTMKTRFEALQRELGEVKRPYDAHQKRLRADIQRHYNGIDAAKKQLETLGKVNKDIARQTNAIQQERRELKDTIAKYEQQIQQLNLKIRDARARDAELVKKEQEAHATRQGASGAQTERERERLRKLETEVKTLQSMQHVSNKQWQTALGYSENIKSTIETKKDSWTQNWQGWTYRDIVAWICQLEDGRFSRYQDILKQKLAQLDVRGKKIQSLNGLVLESFGIHSGADCQRIEAAITKLTDQNTNNDRQKEIARKATVRREATLNEQQETMEKEMAQINSQKNQIAAEWRKIREEKERQKKEQATAATAEREARRPSSSAKNTRAEDKDAALKKAVQEREREEEERRRRAEQMASTEDELRNESDRKVTEWVVKSGKFLLHHGDIRVMLNSMHDIFPYFDNPDKFAVNKSTAELKDVKKIYFKASRLLHPDRHINSDPAKRVLASCVFTSVSDAYERFNKCYGGE